MGSAWEGDWAGRIDTFAKDAGCLDILDYLLKHPGPDLTEVAKAVGDAAAIQIERLAVEKALAQRQMGRLVCDVFVRAVRQNASEQRSRPRDAMYFYVRNQFPEPYSRLVTSMSQCLRDDPPPLEWLPESADDEHIQRAYDAAFSALSPQAQRIMLQGEVEPQPGDRYLAAIKPVWDSISIYNGAEVFLSQFGAVPIELGHLFAAHWCRSEICNGGFHQFFYNPTGVLAPEAADGFDAIGMPGCAVIVRQAIAIFGAEFPRDRDERIAFLESKQGKRREDWDPFHALDDPFYEELESEGGGFDHAADRYAQQSGH